MPASHAISALIITTLASVAAVAQPESGAPPAAAPSPPPRIMIVPPCASPDFPGWGRGHAGSAPSWLRADAASELLLDDTAYLSLAPIGTVRLALPLDKPAQPDDRGGLVTVQIASEGTYRIGLGARAWIDVVHDGKAVPSVAHRMGAACSGIAKLVDFSLKPGTYTIQLSAAAAPTVRIAITRLP